MRVADYIAEKCAEEHLTDVFMVTGGAAMHLNDAFSRESRLAIHHLHHEQSCSMAAEAYARLQYRPAIVNVTAGPGGINAMNGVFGAYVDSIPMLIISGQSKRETLVTCNEPRSLRQLGDQEADIISMARSITKYSNIVLDPNEIKYELEKSIYLAVNGRPGPCWLDIPIDVQASHIEPGKILSFVMSEKENHENKNSTKQINLLLEKITNSKRPLIYAGGGIHASNTQNELLIYAEKLNIPIVTAWNNNDLIWDDHPLYAGRPGSVGNRTGNFSVQFCDLLIILGSRLNIRLISYNWECFADKAWKCHVDIDNDELNKPTLNTDLKINVDLQTFFEQSSHLIDKYIQKINKKTKWIEWIKKCHKRFPVIIPERVLSNSKEKLINPYFFIDRLSEFLKVDDIITFGDGTACVAGFQAIKIKKGQRIFHNSGCASMGFALPAAIGATIAQKKKVLSITGDGSLMMNIQELATISGLKLPIILFILDNRGYHSIRQTQSNYFPDNPVGCGEESGLHFPDFERVAKGFNINSLTLSTNSELVEKLPQIMKSNGPLIVVLKIDLDIQFEPKLSSKKLSDGTMITARLEDMSPFLARKELEQLKEEALNL